MKQLLKICVAFLAINLVSSCSTETIKPTAVEDRVPSFDGNKRDSGLIGVSDDGALVTERFVERYNAMIDAYGDEPDFLPPLKRDQGVALAAQESQDANPGRGKIYLMQKSALVYFIKMNQWRKMAKEPTKKKTPGVMARVIDAVVNP